MAVGQRLAAIAAMVPPKSVVADIGSDHGLLIKHLLSQDIITKAYATDNKIGPYNRLKREFQSDARVSVYLADGLTSLPSNVDTIVIAGIGGKLIGAILERGIDKLASVTRIIVSPHNQVDEIRWRLSRLRFQIVDEDIVEEDHTFYDIIVWERGMVSYSEQECRWGPLNLTRCTETLIKRMAARRAEIDRILEKQVPQVKQDELRREKEWLISYGIHT